MTKSKQKKPYTVEWRAKDGQLFRDWSVYSRYKTEKDRDKGLRALLHSGCPWFEYRAGNPKKLNKIEVGKMGEERMMKWFAYAHLPEHLQAVSRPFGELAEKICEEIEGGPERTVALRKLLEAKDAAVRAKLNPGG